MVANRAGNDRVPNTPRRVAGNVAIEKAMGGVRPTPEQVRNQAMVGHVTSDSTLWADMNGHVWRRIPVVHRLTGGFAILFGRITCGGPGTLLNAFEADYMPLSESFPTVPGYTANLQGAMTSVVLDLQAADTGVFPVGMAYATVHEGPQ